MAAKRTTQTTRRTATSRIVTPHIVAEPMPEYRPRPRISIPWEKALPGLYLGMLLGAFMLGAMWQRVEYLKNGGLVANGAQPSAPTQQAAEEVPVTQDQIATAFKGALITFGDTSRKAVFLAIEDPSCPYCSIASGLNPKLNTQAGSQFTLVSDGGTYVAPVVEMKKLVDAGKAAFAYIYTPGHGSGEMATKAMYCAHEKGRFWPVHDRLMTAEGYDLLNNVVKNDKTKTAELVTFIGTAMNANDLKTCLDSGKHDARIAAETQIAQTLGVTGTPGFFVNTARFAGAYSYKDMESTVNAALQ